MNSKTFTSAGNRSFTTTCTTVNTTKPPPPITTNTNTTVNIANTYPTTISTTTTITNTTTNNATNTILSKLTDRATYFAVVSDTCAFNRNLCKTRYSRLPFLDLATQISQRPAPWLYHTSREISSGEYNILTVAFKFVQ
ncbi:UBX domain-containing 2 [Schistosoma japonicum]|uniref:UBX domain-containing 2 n=1 Tax=Schistosoma japonicum TaxID=6182 RepID=A0A4Z2D870_SCHJA|nr:UBX domain-containing 2 [Schistosoma japonicum]